MSCPRHPEGNGPAWCMDCYPEKYAERMSFDKFAGLPPSPPPPPAPPAAGGGAGGGGGGDGLGRFATYCARARLNIPPGKVNWDGSPFAWMRPHGPRTKSKLGRDIVREWLQDNLIPFQEGDDGVAHFVLEEMGAVVVHLGLQGKEGLLEFANLREPGLGADSLLLVGIEPHRARIWRMSPSDSRTLPHYVNDAPGYHNCSFEPDDPPAWLSEVGVWV